MGSEEKKGKERGGKEKIESEEKKGKKKKLGMIKK